MPWPQSVSRSSTLQLNVTGSFERQVKVSVGFFDSGLGWLVNLTEGGVRSGKVSK